MTTTPSGTSVGSPAKQVYEAAIPAATILQTQTATLGIVTKTGYVTAARLVGLANITGANNPASRKFTILDPTTRVVTDGIVAVTGTSAFKGLWASGSYTTGDLVVSNGTLYVAIASVTTEAPTDTTKWQALDQVGLGYLTSRTANFTADDVGKTISGTGFSGATILGVVNSRTAQVTPNSAVRNALSTTIGASRTIATLSLVSGVNITAASPASLTLDTSDTKVYKGDVLQVVSAADGGTGLADTGGGTIQVEVTSYSEGT